MMDESKYMYPKVSIIILNWNSWKDTIECLESLYQINYPNYNVILVDNNSQNDSIEKIKRYCEGEIPVESKFFKYNQENKPITIIEYTREEAEFGGGKENEIKNLPSNRKLIIIKNEKNYGFAEGSNIGIRYTLKSLNPDYVLLLNNDTVVDKEFLRELVKVGESDYKIGIVGPKIYYYNFNERSDVIWFAGGKINLFAFEIYKIYSHIGQNEQDLGQCSTIKDVKWITGAALMIKSNILKKLSLLNSKYFMGHEDVEYCIKARKQNIKIVYVPSSKIWHKIGMSRPKSLSTKNKFSEISSYFLFIKTNFSKLIYFYYIFLFFVISLPKLVIRYIIKHEYKETSYSDISCFIRFLKKLI